MGNLPEKYLKDWADEGQFLMVIACDSQLKFCAEAEMQHWQEEWDRKQVEFMRCIWSFSKMSDVWAALLKLSISEGLVAYAWKKSAMFLRMKQIAQGKFNPAGYSNQVLQEGQILTDDRSYLGRSQQDGGM
jgi:hypothetical protein